MNLSIPLATWLIAATLTFYASVGGTEPSKASRGPSPERPSGARVEKMPARGDAAAETAVSVPFDNLRVVHLRRLSAKSARRSLHQVFKDEAGLRMGHNSERNAVVMRGQSKLLDQAAHVLAALEEEAPCDDRHLPVHAIRLRHARAQGAVPILNTFFGRRTGGDADLACDPRTNSILVRCPPETVEQIKTLVRQIDVALEPERAEKAPQRRSVGRGVRKPGPPPAPAEPKADRQEPRT